MVAAKVWMWRATSPSVAGRPAEDAGQAGARIAALVGAAQQEVGRDRVQEQPRQCPSAVTADAADQPDREPAAAFAPLLPGVVHAATSPLASSCPSCSTRKRQRDAGASGRDRSEEHTSELQSLMRISYAVF